MGKKESILFIVTIISLIIFLFIFLNVGSKSPNKEFVSLTGNVILDLNEFEIGDKIVGEIFIKKEKGYGILLLSKNGKEILAESFSLNDFSTNGLIKIEDLIDYKFEEQGEYELFFSALESDMNIKKNFFVNEKI